METGVVGFEKDGELTRRVGTVYDSKIGTNVRVDIGWGVGLAGRLASCEVCDNGYSFIIDPAIVYKPSGLPELRAGGEILTSNGGATSVVGIGEDLPAYFAEIISEKIKQNPAIMSPKEKLARILGL